MEHVNLSKIVEWPLFQMLPTKVKVSVLHPAQARVTIRLVVCIAGSQTNREVKVCDQMPNLLTTRQLETLNVVYSAIFINFRQIIYDDLFVYTLV